MDTPTANNLIAGPTTVSTSTHIDETLFDPTYSGLQDIPRKDSKGLWIFGESESKRRVIFIERKNGSYGFTLQSYGVRYKHGHRDTDFITYVNALEKDGAAHEAGLREGDVILSINGQNMARVEHKSLVGYIRQCPSHLKMVVVSDERARKVELHMRYVHLQKKLQDKVKELEDLTKQEKLILSGKLHCANANTARSASATASKVCCFCPPQSVSKKCDPPCSHSKHFAQTSGSNPLLIINTKSELEEEKLKHVIQQRSKSVKIERDRSPNPGVAEQILGDNGSSSFFDSYSRKCQSSRELNLAKQDASKSNTNVLGEDGNHAVLKPKSWDNLVAKNSHSSVGKGYGGYGFGYGYGYFPTQPHKESHYTGSTDNFSHPHHHNHHSHFVHNLHKKQQQQQPHCNYSPTGADQQRQKVKVVYNYVAPTYHTMIPKTVEDTRRNIYTTNLDSAYNKKGYGVVNDSGNETKSSQILNKSKTLPSKRGTGTTNPTGTCPYGSTNCNSQGASSRSQKMERTFSDSSLSDHQYSTKELPLPCTSSNNSKTITTYFKRSGDNVRFSSDEELEIYGNNRRRIIQQPRKAHAQDKERIYV